MKVKCPNPECGAELNADERAAGKRVSCASCGQTFQMPPISVGAAPAAEQQSSPVKANAAGSIDVEGTLRESVGAVTQGAIIIAACVVGQVVVVLLPGMDMQIGRGSLAFWIRAALAVTILVIMLRLLRPLRMLVDYYIGLLFRVSSVLASDSETRATVSETGLYTVLLIYVAILYQATIPSILGVLSLLTGYHSTLASLIKLAFAVAAIVLLVKIIMKIKPLAMRVTKSVTDRAVDLTAKADSKVCASCGARVDLAAKFCPSCGKPA